jgi:hypothetical protein
LKFTVLRETEEIFRLFNGIVKHILSAKEKERARQASESRNGSPDPGNNLS